MKVLVLYRPSSEHARTIEEFVRDYGKRNGSEHVELMDVDTREGSATATLYDIMQYPAIIVSRGDGSVLNSWQGEQLPLMDEITAYANA